MTVLCVVAGCRIRGWHLSDCDDDKCSGCQPRPTGGAYACDVCAERTGRRLHEIADMADAARSVARRQTGNGLDDAGGGTTHSLPFDTMATAKLGAIGNTITGWARHVGETRGIGLPQPPVVLPNPMIGPLCRTRYECTHDSCKIIRDGDEQRWDPIAAAALFLIRHVEWFRHTPVAAEFIADVDACHRIIAGIVRGPADRRYLGPCGAPISPESHEPADPDTPGTIDCPGDVYGHPGATYGVCRVCGASYDTDTRRTWLDDTVRDYAFPASDIEKAYKIRANTIRVWANRGKLAPHGKDADGRPLFNLGEVLEVARYDVAQKETERAARARRIESRRSA